MEQEQGKDVGSLSCDVPVKISSSPKSEHVNKCLNLPSADLLEHLSMHFLAEGTQQTGAKKPVYIAVHHSKPELLHQWCSP